MVHDVQCAAILALYKAPYILVYHSQGSQLSEQLSSGNQLGYINKLLYNIEEFLAFRKARRVYFPSLGAKEVYLSTTKVNKKRPFKIGHPLYNTIRPLARAAGITNKSKTLINGVDLKGTVFISAGNFWWFKGMDQIPPFLKKYIEYTKNQCTWIVVGKGKYEQAVRDAVIKNGIQDVSFFINSDKRIQHSEVLKLMELADCYIMLHRLSIFDLATLEAMRAGCALVLSDVGGNLEYNLRDNVIFVSEGMEQEAIQKLTADLERLGHRNKQVFEEYFNAEDFKRRYINAFRELITDKE